MQRLSLCKTRLIACCARSLRAVTLVSAVRQSKVCGMGDTRSGFEAYRYAARNGCSLGLKLLHRIRLEVAVQNHIGDCCTVRTPQLRRWVPDEGLTPWVTSKAKPLLRTASVLALGIA